MEIYCKNCGGTQCTRNGKVRNKQRFKCKECSCNFVIGDKREKASPQAKALSVLLYGTGKSSYGFIAKLFNVTRPAVLKWLRNASGRLAEPTIDDELKELQFNEVWHFICEKNKSGASGGPWIALQTKPSDDLLAIVLLRPLKGSVEKNHAT